MCIRRLIAHWGILEALVLAVCVLLTDAEKNVVNEPSPRTTKDFVQDKSSKMSADVDNQQRLDASPVIINYTTSTVSGMSEDDILCVNVTPHKLWVECICSHRPCHTQMDAGCRNFEFVVSFLLVGLTCLFGLIGNVLSILTLQRDSIKSVTTFLLSALAVADFAFLIPAVFVIMIPTYCEFYQHCLSAVKSMIPHFEQYGWAIASTTHSCTVYVTVLVAIHRYLWVCKPGLAQKLSGLNRAKVQVAIVPICALIYNSPRFVEYRIHQVTGVHNNGTQHRAETIKELTIVGRNKYFQFVYKNLCFFIIMYLIPLTILVLVSVNLIRTLRQRRATLQRIGSTNSNASQVRRDDNITFVLIIIIAAFIVCQTPTMLQRLLLAVAGDTGHTCGHPYFYLEHIADYMALLNSSTNFVIYILFSPHFRRTLTSELLCKGNNTPAAVAMKHFSRLSKSYKKPSDEKKSTLMARDARPNDINDPNPGPNSHLTGSSPHLHNGQNKNVHQLTPPYFMDKSGSITVSTQVTSHEFLVSSHNDVNEADTCNHALSSIRRRSEHQIRAELNETHPRIDTAPDTPDEEREIEIPLIAFEGASSIVDTT